MTVKILSRDEDSNQQSKKATSIVYHINLQDLSVKIEDTHL